jgi:hypothetical protein
MLKKTFSVEFAMKKNGMLMYLEKLALFSAYYKLQKTATVNIV